MIFVFYCMSLRLHLQYTIKDYHHVASQLKGTAQDTWLMLCALTKPVATSKLEVAAQK